MNEEEFKDIMRYQSLLSRQVVQEARTDRKLKLLDLFNALSTSSKKRIQTAALIHEAEQHGFSESEAYDLLDELVSDGFLSDVEKGYVKRA